MKPVTIEEFIAHLRTGTGGVCPCCDSPFRGSLTDMHGQMRCYTCGCTCQVMSGKLAPEFLAEHNLKESEIAVPYCDCIEELPLLRAYWKETKRRVPKGCFLGFGSNLPNAVSPQEVDGYYRWLAANHSRLRPAWDNYLYWDRLIATYGAQA